MINLIYVEWLDAITMKDGWYAKDQAEEWGRSEDWLIKQVGYLIEETKKYVVLATKFNPQRFGDDKFSEITKIPKGWIKKRKILTTYVSF